MESLFRCRSMAGDYDVNDLNIPRRTEHPQCDFNNNRETPEFYKLFESEKKQTISQESHERCCIRNIGTIPTKDWKPAKRLFGKRKLLGRGVCGIVEKGTYKPTGETVAKKTMVYLCDPLKRVLMEASMMRLLEKTGYSPKCYGIIVEDEKEPAIIMEYLKGYVNLLDVLNSKKHKLTDYQRNKITLETAKALASFHRAGVYHNDIKLDNVMVNLSHPKNPKVKIIDFGNAANWPITLSEYRSEGERSAHMAPELYNGLPSCPTSDVYSFGVLVRHMAVGAQMPEDFDSLDSLCTKVAPTERPSMDNVCTILEGFQA